MSAGICGKRLGLEEIFGSPLPSPPSAKRSRCSRYGSPVHHSNSDFGLGSEDKLSILLRMFPAMDRKVVEAVLNTQDHRIDDAIKSLHALCLGDGSLSTEGVSPDLQSDDSVGFVNSQTSGQKVEVSENDGENFQSGEAGKGTSWVDIFVKEMMNASDWGDRRCRAMKILEAFEGNVVAQTTAVVENESNLLKEQLHCLVRDNQILKRAVAIQHERNSENEEKIREVQHLKHAICQYQEQVRALEMHNYSLKIHLQKAQEANSIPDCIATSGVSLLGYGMDGYRMNMAFRLPVFFFFFDSHGVVSWLHDLNKIRIMACLDIRIICMDL
ncbi:hypothetical protein OPV22_004652 [Ensete ventricosum]|uniref:CUE domain-containing protein n=1 Tax=Ensete ventricosum TaxID=4639 RepID=A0AAV8RGR2_ENSVE|nr:hypothetical protein OPV22_004652 [Ensete ventricosum]